MNQIEYNRRQTEELQKRHAMQSRQQPRELKVRLCSDLNLFFS